MEAIRPQHPSASLGGYEWRAYDLLVELASAPDYYKPHIQAQLTTLKANFRRANPGKKLVPAPFPFALLKAKASVGRPTKGHA